jgi:hypothetical protein
VGLTRGSPMSARSSVRLGGLRDGEKGKWAEPGENGPRRKLPSSSSFLFLFLFCSLFQVYNIQLKFKFPILSSDS